MIIRKFIHFNKDSIKDVNDFIKFILQINTKKVSKISSYEDLNNNADQAETLAFSVSLSAKVSTLTC